MRVSQLELFYSFNASEVFFEPLHESTLAQEAQKSHQSYVPFSSKVTAIEYEKKKEYFFKWQESCLN